MLKAARLITRVARIAQSLAKAPDSRPVSVVLPSEEITVDRQKSAISQSWHEPCYVETGQQGLGIGEMRRRIFGGMMFLALILGMIAALLFSPLGDYISLERLKESRDGLVELIEARPLLYAGAFFLACIVATAVCFPAAPMIGICAGALFGFWAGLAIVAVASSIGSTIAFLDSRYFFRAWLKRRFAARFAVIDSRIERHGAIYLLALRLNPLIPYWLVNLAMGLTKMRVTTYIPLTAAGLLPATFLYVNAGVHLARVEHMGEIFSAQLIVALLLISLLPLIVARFSAAARASAPD
jgi:uncharacterized membrane protein YdjX (TVP38/TMEM64 family)